MIGVILCTHATFADGLKNAVEMILGKQEDFDSICFMNGDDLEGLAEKISDAAQKYIDRGMQCCIVTDLYGATPFNTSLKVALEKDINVVTGVNLPFMLEIFLNRDSCSGDIHQFLKETMDNIKESMQVVNPKVLFSE